jgi:hypothetical protein
MGDGTSRGVLNRAGAMVGSRSHGYAISPIVGMHLRAFAAMAAQLPAARRLRYCDGEELVIWS